MMKIAVGKTVIAVQEIIGTDSRESYIIFVGRHQGRVDLNGFSYRIHVIQDEVLLGITYY
jgi:hypothetical protein